MVYIAKQATFDAEDLVIIPPPKRPVMLKSGGAIMEVLEELDGEVLCEWDDGRVWYPRECLYSLVPFQSKLTSEASDTLP